MATAAAVHILHRGAIPATASTIGNMTPRAISAVAEAQCPVREVGSVLDLADIFGVERSHIDAGGVTID